MIPCYVCGRDASTGWTKGFTPAPDSQKLALCAEHNNAENRRAVALAWQELLRRGIESATNLARHKAEPSAQVVTVHFTGGGLLSFTCLKAAPTEHGTLCIEAPDGSRTYVPMQHVREYVLRPVIHSPERPEQKAARPDAAHKAPESPDAVTKAPELPDAAQKTPAREKLPVGRS